MTLSVTSNSADARIFLVHFAGSLQQRRKLNQLLADRLCEELKVYFQSRSGEPNKMGAPSSGFWNSQAAATGVLEVSDDGATVGAGDYRLKIQVFGGTIVPTGGRKFLTIPLITAARGLRVSTYEQASGHKLFRLPGSRVLVERSDQGDRSLLSGSQVTMRRSRSHIVGEGYQKIAIRGRSQVLAVYALCPSVTVPKDPFALPDSKDLAAALAESGQTWLATLATLAAP